MGLRLRSRRSGGVALAVLALPLVALPLAPRAEGNRDIPVGMYNVNNQVMNSGRYLYALRFVIDQDTPVYRFISGFNLEGSDYLNALARRGIIDESRRGYSRGTGGTIRARLVRVRGNGEPDLRHVLAEETVGAVRRYKQSLAAFAIPRELRTQLLYFDFGGVALRGGVPYAVVYQNVARRPEANWFSENSPTVRASQAGPNGRGALDAGAPGAIAGLDPREAVGWSTDGGRSWVWGRRVGEGPTPGAYAGSARGDDGVRLPWYGWQAAPGVPAVSSQPYYAYRRSGNYRVTVGPVGEGVVLRRAGGYAAVGHRVGRVTVTNLATGQTGTTPTLGSGIVTGRLVPSVTVDAGQAYAITHTGSVLKQEGDVFVQRTFGGSLAPGVVTAGAPGDRAELFALP